MARRAQLTLDVRKLDIYDALIKEIRDKNLLPLADETTLKITALEQYKPTINTDVKKLVERLERYISINGNKRVGRQEMCKIMKISRPTLDSWIEKDIVSWDYFGMSLELLEKWIYLFNQDMKPILQSDNKILIGELFGELYNNGTLDKENLSYLFDVIKDVITLPEYCSECIKCDLNKSCSYVDTNFGKIRTMRYENENHYEHIVKCYKSYNSNYVVFWRNCRLINIYQSLIRDTYNHYRKYKFRKYDNRILLGMNLLAFTRQLKKMIED
ncbi:MAG: hypothetical protein K2G93_00635 [Rikenella sp.]|nr:hypothetical protein [Rikenella sp.]